MHSRLPLFAGVPGRTAAAALTAALVITGCAPNPFGPPESSDLEPLSAADAVPADAQQTVRDSVDQAAAALAQRINDSRPDHAVAAAGEMSAKPPSASAGNDDAEHPSDPPDGTGAQRHRDQLDSWSSSVSEAHQSAQEQALREAEAAEAEAEAERQRQQQEQQQEQADETPDPEEEAPAQQQADQGEDDDVAEQQSEGSGIDQPAPELNEPSAEPESPSGSAVEFTGDLSTYLQDLAAAQPGEISISLQEITGSQRSAAVGGDTTRVTASTYKLYLAYSIIRQVESGNLDWSDSVTDGKDLGQCFQDMIVISDNPCPEAIGPEIGWGTVYSDAAAAGAASTGQGSGAIVTTANDLTSMLVRLATGQLAMSESGHENLRGALESNVHRLGIPAGSAGHVLNKPGWIDGYVHDAAIVQHSQGTYVLSITSEGSSWSSLASITSDIEAALYG